MKRDFRRTCGPLKFGLAVIVISLLCTCEESLPPRIHPSDIDPAEYLAESSSVQGGIVFYEYSDSTTSSLPGTLFLSVTNLHDEVLSGPEDITLETEYVLTDFPGDTIRVIGDRDNLLNPYNYQGEVFMLDGDILTIHPDSSALFQVTFDHNTEDLWNLANPRFVVDSCIYPPCGQYIVTDSLRMSVGASVRLFENQTIALKTQNRAFTLSYVFVVRQFSHIEFEELEVLADVNDVVVRWITSFQWRVHSFVAERSEYPDGGFQPIPGGSIAPAGMPADTVEYSVTDIDPGAGTWYYRLSIMEQFPPIGPLIVQSFGPFEVVLP